VAAYNPHARLRLQKVKAIYPGSFDPTTNGHLDVIARAARIFDHLVIAVLNNSQKTALFSVPERVEMLTEATAHIENVSVATFDGLMVEFARQQEAQAVVRGIRAISDYEYEFQMALMNRRLAPELETVFMMPAERYSYVSSRLIKEVFRLGGSVDGLVPPKIVDRLRERAKRNLSLSEGES
jgi:pantetheine-phosphate adenylyltransferase